MGRDGAATATNDVRLRPPRAGDGGDLAACWIEFGEEYARLDPGIFQVPRAEGLAAWIEQTWLRPRAEDELMLVAERAGAVVGCVIAALRRPGADAAWQVTREPAVVHLWVGLLMVRPTERRRGVGAALMAAAEEWGRSRGAVAALLDTYRHSPTSVPFYERLGYVQRALRYRKELTPPSDGAA
jgi:GNAT superfamily N-acetyltransferase